jgi:hypothetical protein
MIFITVYGFAHGNIKKLLAPIDGNNNFCGVGDYKEYPNLYIGNLLDAVAEGALTPSAAFKTAVCVKTCPVSVSSGTGDRELGVECK